MTTKSTSEEQLLSSDGLALTIKEKYLGGLHFPPDPIFQSKALDLHSCGVQQDMTRFRILEKTWGKWEILGFLAIQVQSRRRATEVYSVTKLRTFAKRERHNF